MAHSVAISVEHAQPFHALYPVDTRPVQPRHERVIDGGVRPAPCGQRPHTPLRARRVSHTPPRHRSLCSRAVPD